MLSITLSRPVFPTKQMLNSRLFRYLVAGGLSYVCEMIALLGLKRSFGFSSLASVAISFWVGFVVAFLLQKLFAFENHDKRIHMVIRQLLGYSALVAWNYSFTLLSVTLFTNVASVFVIRTAAILIITSWNYLLYRIIFKKSLNM